MATPQYNTTYSDFNILPGTPLIEILKTHAAHSQFRKQNFETWTKWDMRLGFVYLFYFPMGDAYKIGMSQEVESRIAAIQSNVPIELKIEHVIKTDDMPIVERSFHEYFRDKCIRGEWFDLTKDDVSLFKSIQEITIHFDR
jgi:hypothetical protein